jgi:hypothetical protein
MQRRIKKGFLLFWFLFFTVLTINAQDSKEQQSLAQIIQNLQQSYNVQFNYAQDLVDNIFIAPPPQNISLQEALQYLENNTQLVFSITNNQFVLVTAKQSIIICGYLKNKEGQPLGNATIQSESVLTVSDNNGFFELELPLKAKTITVRYLGYKTLQKPIKELLSRTCETVELIPNFESLSEVIISNFITHGIKKLNNGTYQINFNEFDILPGVIDTDVLQSVQAFPGIQSINETVSNISIRGGAHDQNLLLWDNIKMYQSGHFFGLISMYNPQITQSVSLVKNGTDVALTDGVSGTIDMKTEKELNTKFKGSLGANLTDVNGFADVPIGKKSSFQFAARKSISDFVKTPTYNEFFDRISQNTEVETNMGDIINSDKEFDFYDASLRWIYKISEKDELRLNFITVSNRLLFNENAMVNGVEDSRESSLTQNSIAGAIRYDREWNTKLKTALEIYETDYKLKAVNVNILDSQRYLQENVVSETSLKLISNYKLNPKMQLLSGYHFVETEVTNLDDVDNPLYKLLVSEVVRTHGVFSQFGYTSTNRNTNINAGVRFNYIDKFKKTIWEPRLSFSQRFLEDFTFEILGEFKHQNTSQVINVQNDFFGIEKRRWQLSNDDNIPVITSKQVSTGVSFSKKGWLLSLEGYYKNVDGITSRSQGFQNQYELSRTSGSYEVKGLDVLLRKGFDKVSAWLSYSFMDNNYEFKSLQETVFPSNYNIRHAITFGTTYSSNRFKVSAGLNWHSGKPTTNPMVLNPISDGEINYEASNNSNLQDYLRVDVSAIYNLKISEKVNSHLGLSVWNVLNKENQINKFYSLENNSVTQSIQHSLGITPNAVFRVYF